MLRLPLQRVVALAAALVTCVGGARADDEKAAADGIAARNWSGRYVGGHVGYGGGGYGSGTTVQPAEGVFLPPSSTGLIGGLQAGIARQFNGGVVVGAEIDATAPGPADASASRAAPFVTSLDYFATMRARAGIATGRVMPYLTGGLAVARTRTTNEDAAGAPLASKPVTHVGWTAGAGLEWAIGSRLSARAEYDYLAFAGRFAGVEVRPDAHVFKIGLDYALDAKPVAAPAEGFGSGSKDWSMHVQTTTIVQGYPAFRSPYSGANSLPAGGETRETVTATAFIGARIAPGLEIYFDPELDQGGGVGKTLGLAGFANGEAQKGGSEFPKFRPQRYYLVKTIGLGGEQEKIEDAPNQLAQTIDVNRLRFIAGRFAVGDFFDNNAYAHDPRIDFLNWSMWASAAYDFPADLPGFTRGAIAELNTKDWALRAGLFQVPSEPNSDVLAFKTGGLVVEFENRYTLAGQGGKLRVGAFANRGFTGNYDQALALLAANPALDATTALEATRAQRDKYGFYANLEQAVTKDLGIFARASWNDGRSEILSFTDIDASFSAGLSLKGTAWGRANDTVGIGAAFNRLSAGHRDYLAAGGSGLLIGDGALAYRPEKAFETYYAMNIGKGRTLTGDYQLIFDPAYNADRGPVSLFAARLHIEY